MDGKETELYPLPPKSGSQSTINSNSQLEESGLSASSNSLTDVSSLWHARFMYAAKRNSNRITTEPVSVGRQPCMGDLHSPYAMQLAIREGKAAEIG